MSLNNFLKLASQRERADLAMRCNFPVFILYQLAGHHRPASHQMAIRIEQASRAVAGRSATRLAAVPRSSLLRAPLDTCGDQIIEDADSMPGKPAMRQGRPLIKRAAEVRQHEEPIGIAEGFSPSRQTTDQM